MTRKTAGRVVEGRHCQQCGTTDYESLETGDQGYTACCNELVMTECDPGGFCSHGEDDGLDYSVENREGDPAFNGAFDRW